MLGCCIRRTAGLVGLLVAVALIAAPAALAQSQTSITGAAAVQFNGVIDSSPQCTDATAIRVAWGDGSTAATIRSLSDGEVLGTHTYASAGTYNGTLTFTGGTSGSCEGASSPDTFTATVGGTPQFTQCPQLGDDTGCQFLIDVTPGGVTVLQDTNQGPYEGSEDALIGVTNNSSSALSSIPISTPGSDTFSFDGDGICDANTEVGNDAPFPAGCQQISPVGSCDPTSGNPCAYPPAPGEPGPDADAYTGSNQNGYEGPQNYFTNVATTLDSGTVVFSPALQPGQSTFFTLEEPPSAAAINVGSTPVGPAFTGAPTVTATGASFSGVVDPNGSATTAAFQYGLDLKYSKPGQSGPNYTNTTPAQAVGGDFANHSVTATVAGLVPNALYHARLVATNKNGSSFGPDITFTTGHGPTPGSPTLGKNFNISLVNGLVLIKIHGKFIPLTELTQIPKNTVINALHGTLSLITAAPGGSHPTADVAAKGKGKKGKGKTVTQKGSFGGAVFKITQAAGGPSKGLATLSIVESAFKGAPGYSLCKKGGKKKAGDASAAAVSSKVLQLLHASAKGKFRTSGKYSAATVRGTKWTVADRCDGTLTHDLTDSVSVTDFVLHKTVILHAGQSYLAKKP
jgi:hypothetical protein